MSIFSISAAAQTHAQPNDQREDNQVTSYALPIITACGLLTATLIWSNRKLFTIEGAIERGNFFMFDLLKKVGANSSAKDSEGRNAVTRGLCRAIEKDDVNVINTAIERSFIVPYFMNYAAECGSINIINTFIQNITKLRKSPDEDFFSLDSLCSKSIEHGHVEAAKLLLPAASQALKKTRLSSDNWGKDHLISIIERGLSELIEPLLEICSENKYKIDLKGFIRGLEIGDRMTCMHIAAEYGQADCIRILYKHHAEINQTTKKVITHTIRTASAVGWKEELISDKTPLHLAAKGKHADAVQTLLELGADTQIKDNDGNTALDLARDIDGNEEVVKLLEDIFSG